MSLVKNSNSEASLEREELRTVSEVKNEIVQDIKEQNRKYQKEQRAKHMGNWNAKKDLVQKMSSIELEEFITTCSDDPRVGFHPLKINAKELAIIKLALSKTKARSSRELFIDYCKNINSK